MVVGLDLRCLPNDGTEGAGIAHAARALCAELIKDRTYRWIAYVPRQAVWDSKNRQDLKDGSRRSLVRAMHRQPCDLLFVPSGAVSPGLPVPAVPWVHDLIIFDHPEWFPQNWLKRQLTTRLFLHGLKKAPHVLCVSAYTKQAIIRHAALSADRITVTGEGGDEELAKLDPSDMAAIKAMARAYCQKELSLPRPFVLSLGTLEPRKNIALLIRAWERTKGKGMDLVIAGQDGWKFDDVRREIDGLSDEIKPHLRRLENITDQARRQLLLAAQAVATPSLDEGFGLVALEALQAGTEIIASDRGAMPEVVGRAARLLDPQDERVWARAIGRMSKIECRKSNVGQAKEFNWEKTAAIALRVFKGLAKP